MKLIPYYKNIMYQIYAKNGQTYIANMDVKYIYINVFDVLTYGMWKSSSSYWNC